jgi:hypothetical protein
VEKPPALQAWKTEPFSTFPLPGYYEYFHLSLHAVDELTVERRAESLSQKSGLERPYQLLRKPACADPHYG